MDDATQSLCFTGQVTTAGHRAERRTNVNKAPSNKPPSMGGLFKRAEVDPPLKVSRYLVGQYFLHYPLQGRDYLTGEPRIALAPTKVKW